jgi:Family of unknown function (DUF6496)
MTRLAWSALRRITWPLPKEKGMAKKQSLASRKVERSMHELKAGTLRSGSGTPVTSRAQAIAIGLSEARRMGGEEAGETAPDDEAAEARPRKGSLRNYGRR